MAAMNHENLWAPWRLAYLRELQRRRDQLGPAPAASPDFIAEYWRSPQDDAAHHVVYRNAHGLIVLNRYPYANGHLLSALGESRPTLLDYSPAQRVEFWKLVDRAAALLQRGLNPQGINMGINQGTAAGAGLPEHLHAHLVPRWHGDTNFLSVVGQVRIIPDSLEAMAAACRDAAVGL
jgi:ATP adenylyltransferase